MTVDRTRGEDSRFVVRFRGVRGSHPTSGQGTESVGGHTSCIEILFDRRRLIFDLGTGVIPLGNELVGKDPVEALVLVSHLHHDHTMGFPFFKPVYDPRTHLVMAGPSQGGRGFQDLLEATFRDPYFPVEPSMMGSKRRYHTLEDGDACSWKRGASDLDALAASPADDELQIRVFRNTRHPNGGVLCYRLEYGGKSIVLATDVEGTEGFDGDLVDFAAGADLLVHDAQYTDDEYEGSTKGWGHSTWRMAADVAARAEAGCLALYHHDPSHDDAQVEDMERKARARFRNCVAAAEGLDIIL